MFNIKIYLLSHFKKKIFQVCHLLNGTEKLHDATLKFSSKNIEIDIEQPVQRYCFNKLMHKYSHKTRVNIRHYS